MKLRVGLVPLLLMIGGCGDPVGGGCDPCRTTAVVFGEARDTNGAPISAVRIHVRSYVGGCPSKQMRGGEVAYTDSAGHYRSLVSSLYSPHTAECISMFLDPALGGSFSTDTLEFPTTLAFRAEDGTARDSVRIDPVFARAGGSQAVR